DPHYPDVFPPGGLDQVVRPPARRPARPARHILLDRPGNLLAGLRVTKPLQQSVDAARQRPGWVDREQRGVGGDVGDDIEAALAAASPGLVVELDRSIDLRPVRPAEGLDVRFLAGDAVLLSHPE